MKNKYNLFLKVYQKYGIVPLNIKISTYSPFILECVVEVGTETYYRDRKIKIELLKYFRKGGL